MKSNRLEELTQNYEALINRKNEICNNSNGIYKRYYHPVLTAEHAPLIWKYDFDEKQNPFMEERIGINAVILSCGACGRSRPKIILCSSRK